MNPQNQLLSEQNFFGTFCVFSLTLVLRGLMMKQSMKQNKKRTVYSDEMDSHKNC